MYNGFVGAYGRVDPNRVPNLANCSVLLKRHENVQKDTDNFLSR
jgi:hypothetical protein